MEQMSIWEFIDDSTVTTKKYGSFIVEFKKGDYVIWLRDFINYNLKENTKLEDITDAEIFNNTTHKVYDLISNELSYETYSKEGLTYYSFDDICTKQYGWYQRHLNEFDYTKRDEFYNQLIKRLKLKVSLNTLLKMTLIEFEILLKEDI